MPGKSNIFNRITDRLFHPVSVQSLALFRIVFGFLGFAHIISYWIGYHFWEDAYNPDKFQFKYIGFEWLPTFHDPWMSIIMLSIAGAGLLVMLGVYYRPAAWYLAVGFTYVFLLEKATYLNHSYLYCWIAFLMPFFPADRAYSVKGKGERGNGKSFMSFWPLFLLRFLMGVVYFYGGIAKINTDWLRAVPLKQWMAVKGEYFLIGPILVQDWVPWAMAYVGLFLDLLSPFFLLNRRTRPYIFLFIIAFHAINAMVFKIGIFPVMSISLTALFFPADFPSRIGRWLEGKWGRLGRWLQKPGLKDVPVGEEHIWRSPLPRWAILTVIGCLILFHLTYPLRHHLFPGDVAFTEEGHRYSWRMMLRSKAATGYFELRDPDSGFTDKVMSYEYLWPRQMRKMKTHPDMIWQFAQFLKEEYADRYPDIEVYAHIRVRLNDHRMQEYIDPTVDLASVDWSFFRHSEWIREQIDN